MNESTDLLCENIYHNLINANIEIAPEILPKKKKNESIFCNNNNTQKAREALTSASSKNRIISTRYTKEYLEEAQDKFDSMYQQEMEQYVKKTLKLQRNFMWKDVVHWLGKRYIKSSIRKVHFCQKSKFPLRLKGCKAGTITCTLEIFL